MNSVLFYRRRAERFAQLLDEAHGGRRHHVRSSVDDDLADVVAIGHRVSALKHSVDVDVDPEFRMSLRASSGRRGGARGDRRDRRHRRDRQPRGVPGRGQRAEATGPPDPHPRRDPGRRRRRRDRHLGHVGGERERGAGRCAVRGQAVHRAGAARAGRARTCPRASCSSTSPATASPRRGPSSDSDGFARALDDMDANTTEGVRLLTTTATQRHEVAALDAIDAFLKRQRTEVGGLLEHHHGCRPPGARGDLGRPAALGGEAGRRAAPVAQVRRRGGEPTDALGPLPGNCPAGSAPADAPAASRRPAAPARRTTSGRRSPTRSRGRPARPPRPARPTGRVPPARHRPRRPRRRATTATSSRTSADLLGGLVPGS